MRWEILHLEHRSSQTNRFIVWNDVFTSAVYAIVDWLSTEWVHRQWGEDGDIIGKTQGLSTSFCWNDRIALPVARRLGECRGIQSACIKKLNLTYIDLHVYRRQRLTTNDPLWGIVFRKIMSFRHKYTAAPTIKDQRSLHWQLTLI